MIKKLVSAIFTRFAKKPKTKTDDYAPGERAHGHLFSLYGGSLDSAVKAENLKAK